MAMSEQEQFSSQLDSERLAWLREIAGKEGREFHEVLEAAIDVYRKHRLRESLGPELFAHLEAVIERMERYHRMREQKSE